ncbi:MAG: N-glycosylase/DNA lyase [Thaumarchaeota archaeon]|jgi:N-glycosylase/DNA lyase|nr:N-glycosylase/DNA lyase [Candidatus Terraquivivens yellowstonensis]MCL7393090.1 N-glycosylase/DNA lyase [Candidatus Terraquivivens yellowstonensis]MCL7398281.1 N-glycosylase/DNA lyase [Candidatus Terraquivivens yellowstonensis]MCL7398760.1 N-glycosylase/DNA lyase [Candidatus Terraquivivens yellowstonensis]MCL7400286.1 N-glycosylase/DNA lyase [Candidatus Terraquivivens yellowstonensis]
MNDTVSNYLKIYEERREEIEARLREFKEVLRKSDEEVFAELCFCICTPQTRARAADAAISIMKEESTLLNGDEKYIADILRKNGVRFPESKARYIVAARAYLRALKSLPSDAYRAREWLVKNIKGLGYKEASHFLRNIGYEGLAILDRHILRGMKEVGVIKEVPKNLTKRTYLELEKKFIQLANDLGMRPEALDLVMWADKTGEVFK